jgi:hypothetical protein
MPLNKITADSITDGTVVASDIADGTITLAKLQSGLLPPATANSAAAYANAAFATANTGTASGSYANSAFATANTGSASGSYANSAFATANTGTAAGSYANSAFTVANNSLGIDTTQNTNITNASTYANSAFAKANTAGVGTVTSVATGNGLSGGTITSTGTLVVACPSFNSVGSYVWGCILSNGGTATYTSGSNYSAGGGHNNVLSFGATNVGGADPSNNLSGTWKWMGSGGYSKFTNPGDPNYGGGVLCRVS